MSARMLSVETMRKVVQRREHEDTDPPDLGPDEMRLYSYYRPGLVAGSYQITATQKVVSSTAQWGQQTLNINNTTARDAKGIDAPQEFEVVVPRFSLDSDMINSYYPPDGHQDEGRVLPHIVLNDPHYPWEIPAGVTPRMTGPIDGPHNVLDLQGKEVASDIYRSIVPWVALLVFDPEDLRFDSLSDFTTTGMSTNPSAEDMATQNPKGIFTRTVNQYLKLPPSGRINYEADDSLFDELLDMTNNVDLIFPTKKLFKQIFAYTASTGSPTTSSGSPVDLSALEAHKYMAHVRHVNTTGFPDAGVEQEGLFSIVVSSRLGAYDIDQPHTQICHLVSIEHIDSTLQAMGSTITAADSTDRIGMVSLFSWIYTALPPNPVNFVDTMRHLVLTQQMLHVDQHVIDSMKDTSAASKVIKNRLQRGYSLSRWRTQSGEVTAAFTRGPLVPGPVKYPVVSDIPDCSNTSQDYQILDPETGLMDLSYASAWQLGKTQAISDTTFSSALMRFRSLVHNSSMQQAQMSVNGVQPASNVLVSVKPMIASMRQLTVKASTEPTRIPTAPGKGAVAIVQDPATTSTFQSTLAENIVLYASAGTDEKTREVYNEFNSQRGNNSDWATIHTWICEKLNLGGIPPQYLMPEPAFVPPESLRFFHIDDFWLDCLLDGALSVANHLDSGDDTVRRQIKSIFNDYLGKDVARAGYRPQIPCCGFVVRSKIIQAMPDLRITVTWQPISDANGKPDDRAPVCRWTKWDSETLFCLLDRPLDELDNITLAQPPHQQRFSLGSYVRKAKKDGPGDLIEFDLRTLYTSENPAADKARDFPFGDGKLGEWIEKLLPASVKPNDWLDFDTRVMRVPVLAEQIHTSLKFSQTNADGSTWRYRDEVANSCELGLELNDPSYYFLIKPKLPKTPTFKSQPLRQLRVDTSRLDPRSDMNTTSTSAQPFATNAPISKLPTGAPPPPQPANSNVSTTRTQSLSPPTSQPRLAIVEPSRLFSNFRASAALPVASSLLFTRITIHADYKPPPALPRNTTDYDPADYICDRNTYFYDLIFTIQKTVPKPQNLLRIDIDIPTSPGSTTKPTKEPLLEANYYGPGARMLSNQRFIPFLFVQDPPASPPGANGTLHIELRPRSADDNYAIPCDDARTSDLSFRLAEAPVSRVRIPTPTNLGGVEDRTIGKADVWVTEWYATESYPRGEPVRARFPYTVLKRQVNEDGD